MLAGRRLTKRSLRRHHCRWGEFFSIFVNCVGERMKQIDWKKPIVVNGAVRRVLLYLAAFWIPLIIGILGLIALGAEPFGTHNIAITDAKWYVDGYVSFSRWMKEGGSLLTSWTSMAWGGFSLGHLLSYFGTLETMPAVFDWSCIVNMAACGMTMYPLMAQLRGHRVSNLIFSTSYALIGFNVVNCYQDLFFIGPQMLPLVMLGLYRLLNGKSPIIYVVSLAVCIFCNFYFGFHLCIVSVLVFALSLWVRRDELIGKKLRLFWCWAVASAVAGFLAAPMWLSALKAYSGGDGRMNQTGIEEFRVSENMPFVQMFSKLFTGANSTDELVSGMPNIFCGILVVALVVLYFMNRRIDRRRKTAAALILVFYLFSFYITAFTLLMHGGTHTNWFPYRYSYVFSFLLICVAAEQYNDLARMTLEETKRCGIALLLGALIVFSVQYEFVSGACVLLDFALLLLMWYAFYMHKTQPEKAPLSVVSLFLLLVVSMNLYLNFVISTYKVREWEKDLQAYQENLVKYAGIIEGVTTADDSFFRMEKGSSDSGTIGADPGLYGYNGISGSGPTMRMFIHRQLCRLGINWFDMRQWYEDQVPAATDSLLGLKYLVTDLDRDMTAEKGYESKISTDSVKLYQNPNALSIGFLSDRSVRELELTDDCFDNLNRIWKNISGGTRDLFTEEQQMSFTLHNEMDAQSITSEEIRESISAEAALSGGTSAAYSDGETPDTHKSGTYIEYSFTAAQDGPVYLYNSTVPASDGGSSAACVKCLGVYKKGDSVTKTLDVNQNYLSRSAFEGVCSGIIIAYADNDLLSEYAKIVNSRDFSIRKVQEHHLTGSFSAEQNQCILFTIPWNEGWSCYIDGQKVPIDKTWDLYMSVEAPEGQHTYELKYFPAWMDVGIGISAAALAVFAVLMIVWKRGQKKELVLKRQ